MVLIIFNHSHTPVALPLLSSQSLPLPSSPSPFFLPFFPPSHLSSCDLLSLMNYKRINRHLITGYITENNVSSSSRNLELHLHSQEGRMRPHDPLHDKILKAQP